MKAKSNFRMRRGVFCLFTTASILEKLSEVLYYVPMNLEFAQTPNGSRIGILSELANRHGLITGATGTGKTITLQVLAEQFSKAGVPVFVADVKGDLSGISQPGTLSEKLKNRLISLNIPEPEVMASPALFWDVFGKSGHPVRSTISEMGPTLLSRLMNLNDTQASVLQVLFKIADEAELLLIDIKDLNALLMFAQENKEALKAQYGHLSPASIGTIQRALLTLEERGAKKFFGEPAFDIHDLLQTDSQGRGYVHVLAADQLLQTPIVYSTFLLWMLSELFENLPEVGDMDKPKLVFFFDEAHLLFKDAPKVLVEKIEQVVRLIRSKGVGVYFVSQNPMDIPATVLGQLAHRVQHALRAFTPSDQKAVKVAAQTLRQNPEFSAEEVITQLGVGEALVSVLDAKGAPTVVERAFIFPPASQMGPINPEARAVLMSQSPVAGHYEKEVDRISAFETLAEQKKNTQPSETLKGPVGVPTSASSSQNNVLKEILFGKTGPRGGRHAGLVEKAATSAARSVATNMAREFSRGLLGSLLGGGSKRKR